MPRAGSSTDSTVAKTVDYATVGEYASIVASLSGEIRTRAAGLDTDCSWVSPGRVSNNPYLDTCSMEPVTISFQARSLSRSLAGAADKHVAAYVGAPPDQIAGLVQQTKVTTKAFARSVQALDHPSYDCIVTNGPDCLELLFEFSAAKDDLVAELDAWDAHLTPARPPAHRPLTPLDRPLLADQTSADARVFSHPTNQPSAKSEHHLPRRKHGRDCQCAGEDGYQPARSLSSPGPCLRNEQTAARSRAP